MTRVVLDIKNSALTTSSDVSGKQLTVRFKGCLDMDSDTALENLLGSIKTALEDGTLREVIFQAHDLYLMNSSAISRVAAWVKAVKVIRPVCRVRFRTNPNLAWQRRTLDSIRRVAEQLLTVE